MCNNSIYMYTYYIYYYLHVYFHFACVREQHNTTHTTTMTKGFTCHIVNTFTGLGIWTATMDIQIVWYQWWWMYWTQWTGQIDLCCAWIDGTTRTSARWWSKGTWTGNNNNNTTDTKTPWQLNFLPFICSRSCFFSFLLVSHLSLCFYRLAICFSK